MLQRIDTRVPEAVEAETTRLYLDLFANGKPGFVSTAFGWARQCFGGQQAGYLASDARYHDFEHTLQGTLCMSRLLHGRHRAGARPVLTRKMFELGLLAILYHDTGYLKKAGDTAGTGAKYTLVHVERSAQFAQEFLSAQGYAWPDIASVQNMIHCTGVSPHPAEIPFQSPLERVVGFALATADLLGQMAAPDYVDKLSVLYLEFAEADRFSKGQLPATARFSSAYDLMCKTHSFWQNYVLPRIQNDFGRLHTFLNDPYPDGPNPYLDQIEQNLARLREKLADLQPGQPRV